MNERTLTLHSGNTSETQQYDTDQLGSGDTQPIDDAVGRRAAIGIMGGAVALILNRWAGVHFGMLPEAIITTEKFVVALAFANTPPALPSGMVIALCSLVTGILGIVFPETLLPGSMVLLVLIVAFVSLDLYKEYKQID